MRFNAEPNTILRAKNVTFQTIKESLSQSFTSFAALCLCIIIETLKMRHGNALKMNGAQLLTWMCTFINISKNTQQ